MERGGVCRILRGERIEPRAVRSSAELEFLRVGANVGVKYQLEKVLQIRTRENLSEGIYWDWLQTSHACQDRVLVGDPCEKEVF